MSTENDEDKLVLPHHKQQELCTTRSPYRQGRKLTAVKVYTVNNESNHLLIFGVPSLNLRQETKLLFLKFGRLLQFNITESYPKEQFTDNYHAVYEKIQSARIAKRMLDTKNFYGGSLHVCYAPELETVEETRQKLLQRQRDVMYRLRNIHKDNGKETITTEERNEVVNTTVENIMLNMGEINTISIGKEDVGFKNKRKNEVQNVVIEKKFKPCFVEETFHCNKNKSKFNNNSGNSEINNSNSEEIEIIDCTSIEKETITNINESLNYNKFGNEVIRKVAEKPLNKIKFNIGNNNRKV